MNIDAKPLVSILINNYNYASFLPDAIDSALAQTYPHTEVIVVDDGSTDNSQEIINSYGNKILAVFKNNGGQASALNAGFVASRGEIICLLDADDIWLPEKVSEVIDLFKSHPNVDWVFNRSVSIKSEDIVKCNFDFKDILHEISEMPNNAKKSEYLSESENIDFRTNILNAQLPTFVPSTSNLCFSRTLLAKIFPLPEVRGFSGTAISDLYIKYLAVGLATGCVTKKNLCIFRQHNNIYSNPKMSINKKRNIYAEIHINSAYWMQVKFPVFSKLSKKIFSKGLATYLRSKTNEFNYEEIIKKYLNTVSYPDKFEIICKSFYYFIKLGFVNFI